MNIRLAYILLLVLPFVSFAGDKEHQQCLELIKMIDNEVGQIACHDNFQHFNADSADKYYNYSDVYGEGVKIASFNVYQPGNDKTEFKDISIVAKIINNWDVVSAIELLPVIGENKRHNDSIYDYYKELEYRYKSLKDTENDKPNIGKTLKFLKTQYDRPGYIRLLKELRKLDPSWSLILAADEEGSEHATIRELSGFYYRAAKVVPKSNEYCHKEKKLSNSFACTFDYTKSFYGKEINKLISRRPFLGSFKSGRFDFSLVAVHIIHNRPSDNELEKKILKEAFNVEDYKVLGGGVRSDTFARFAETKHLLRFTRLLKERYSEQDIIVLGDFNLEADVEFWSEILTEAPGVSVKIEGETSLARSRQLSDGSLTHGLNMNYDHFLFDEIQTSQCAGSKNARIYNFLDNQMTDLLDSRYLLRSKRIGEDDEGNVIISETKSGKAKVKKVKEWYRGFYSSKYTVKRGSLVKRYDVEEKIDDLYSQIFDNQLYNRSFYIHYQELVSDHLPIFVNCKNTYDRD